MSYQTKNTLVAAALVTIGKHEEGYNRDNGSVVWTFSDGIVPPAINIDIAWRDRTYSLKPLYHIIKVANARQWIIDNVIHPERGQYDTEPMEQDCFITQSLAMACCLIAQDHYLRAFNGREFFFAPGAKSLLDKFRSQPISDDPLDWQRRYLSELSSLLRKVKTIVS
jgi:hypothetical protein